MKKYLADELRSTTALWLMVVILLLATCLRLPWLKAQSIAFDESFSLAVGSANWPVLFQAVLSDGVHPPLFYIIHKGALALWGISEFGQRFLAAVFSILSVALIYWAGRTFFNRAVGLLSALLMALNPLQIWFAQEARMYSLLGVLTIISMTTFWQAIRTSQRRYWIRLAVVNSIIFILHYFGFLIPLIQFIFILSTFARNHRQLRPWALAQFIAAIPLLPWLIFTALRERQTFGVGFLIKPTPLDFLETYWNLIIGSQQLAWPIIVITLAIIGVACVMALRPFSSRRTWAKQARLLVGLWVLLPPLITWLISQRHSFYADRYLSFAIPALLLWLAFGVLRLPSPRVRYLVATGLVIISSYGLIMTHLDAEFWKDNWREVAAYVRGQEQAGDVILLYTTHIKFAFDYYYHGDAPQEPISLNLEKFSIEPLVEGHQRVWVVYPYTRRPTHYPRQPLKPEGFWEADPERNPKLADWFASHSHQLVDYHHFPGIEVWLFDLEKVP
jgi:uncharacterized membrane protein